MLGRQASKPTTVNAKWSKETKIKQLDIETARITPFEIETNVVISHS